jgi:hypothetical protein
MPTATMIVWIQVCAGLLLCFLGKRVLWLFLGALGFFLTYNLVCAYLPELPDRSVMILALAGGALTGTLVLLAEKGVVWIGGLLGGGYVGALIWQVVQPSAHGFPWPAIVLGALLGLLTARFLVTLGLAVLTSAVGAALLAVSLPAEQYRMILFVVMFLLGLVVQSGLLRKRGKTSPKEKP